jgi:hypothetical protein
MGARWIPRRKDVKAIRLFYDFRALMRSATSR